MSPWRVRTGNVALICLLSIGYVRSRRLVRSAGDGFRGQPRGIGEIRIVDYVQAYAGPAPMTIRQHGLCDVQKLRVTRVQRREV